MPERGKEDETGGGGGSRLKMQEGMPETGKEEKIREYS